MIRAVANRLSGHEEDIARRIAARFREELVDYGAGGDHLMRDAATLARDNLEDFLANLRSGEPTSARQLERMRLAAARRVHQGVSLTTFLHASRIWGLYTWEALRAVIGETPGEVAAALVIASLVMRHVDALSTVASHAYVEESQGLSDDGHLLPWDLLEELIGMTPDPDKAVRRAHTVGVRLGDNYIALSIRGPANEMRAMIDAARHWLRPPNGALLLGLRDAEVVALYPLREGAGVHAVKSQADGLAGALGPAGVSVGLSGWHPGLSGVALAYAEAKEAAQMAAAGGGTGRAVSLDEVLIDYIARSTPHVGRILDETLHPLVEYDLRHRTALVETVRTYVETGFNLRRSAEVLHVHPNTVMYRLRRVRELCGRDPHDPDDLLMLFLAMKLAELSPARCP